MGCLNQVFRIDGFEQVVQGAILKCFEGKFVVRRGEYHFKIGPWENVEYVEPGAGFQVDIEENDGRPVFPDGREGFLHCAGLGAYGQVRAKTFDEPAQDAPGVGFVVDEEGAVSMAVHLSNLKSIRAAAESKPPFLFLLPAQGTPRRLPDVIFSAAIIPAAGW